MLKPENLDRFETLVDIIAYLRSPDGCPWDREQTHASLRENLLEECYEVLEALDAGVPERLCEELGDLLLQIVLHAQIASETGDFEMGDVLTRISSKLIRRHPHIFGDIRAKDADEVRLNWEVLKRKERDGRASMLDGVSRRMPALAYSQRVQSRVARVGFDWKEPGDIIDKLAEEIGEFQQADSSEERGREFGDLLFTLVNIARREGIDSESALREANGRFYRRFAWMENACRERGQTLSDLSYDDQNALWEEAKRNTGGEDNGRGERT